MIAPKVIEIGDEPHSKHTNDSFKDEIKRFFASLVSQTPLNPDPNVIIVQLF